MKKIFPKKILKKDMIPHVAHYQIDSLSATSRK